MDKNSSLYKTILLGVVCAAAGLLLSLVNSVTEPVIKENEIASIKASLQEIYPDESNFADVTNDYISQDETGLIDGIYQAGDQGYIFTLHNTGYDAGGFKFMIGFNTDGQISGYKGLESNETSGKGSKAFEADYIGQVTSLTSSDAMPLISGATVTTSAVGEAVTAAEKVFNGIVGISADLDNAKPVTVTKTLGEEDYSSLKAECTDNGDGVYACSALGYVGVEYGSKPNTATITVKDGKVESIADFDGGDNGDQIGDDVFTDAAYLDNFTGADLTSDIQTGATATFTEDSLKAMIVAALEAAGN